MLASLLTLTCTSRTHAERLPIKTYTTADGLPRDHINHIVQDSKGFMWFCTTEGLSRFDGYNFTNYGTEQGLAGRQVNDFLETRNGTYWAATDKGLCRFNPDPLPLNARGNGRDSSQRFVAYYPGEEASARFIEVIYEDHAGTIWCGTEAGLFRLDEVNGQWVFSFVDIIQPFGAYVDKGARAILEDRRGALWISAESGLYRRRPDGEPERYAAEEGLPVPVSPKALLEDHEGRIWAGTGYGLYELVADPKPHRPVVARLYTTKDRLSSNSVTSLYQSSDGRLWVGTERGLSEFLPAENKDGERFQSYTSVNGLSGNFVTALAEDRDGNLWIGTDVGGALRLGAHGFTTYNQADGLGGIRISSIFEDRRGDLCVIGGEGYLNRFDARRFAAARLTLPRGMSKWSWGWYQVLFQDRVGEWWLPTAEGLVRYPKLDNVEQITRARPKAIYTTRDGLPANEIFRLFEDSRGDIWISTLGNLRGVLTRWERATETFHRYTPADGIPKTAPTAFCEDASGSLWIGFYGGGLLRYSAGRFTPFTESDGVPPGFVRGLYLDHVGRLWDAAGEGGVARVDDPGAEHPRFVTYSAADGLSSNQATCVTEDQWGMIYIGTGRGLDKLDPATGRIRHYTTTDGLANSFINVAFRQRDGSLWFGTLQGLSRLMPQPERAASPPPILITALRIAGVGYPLSELGASAVVVPQLGASQNNIQIEFAGLSLAVGESLRYQYKLEGADRDWSAPAEQRTVNYPNLAPGIYSFLVRAVTADGTLSESPATVSFKILPPIWQRWWFVAIAALIIASAVFAFARYRYQRMKAVLEAEEALRRSREERLIELERVRTRIATDLHDDIGSSLTQIAILSEVTRKRMDSGDNEKGAEPLARIISVSNELVDTMSDIVWAINPKKDYLSDLLQRMRRFASDVFTARNIAFRFRASDQEHDIELGANVRREIFLIFKESINNIVKHSGCTRAEIEFQIEGDWLTLKVNDNGKGFDSTFAVGGSSPVTSSARGGNGLLSMRRRAEEMGGQFEIVSRKGEGTTVTLRVLAGSARF